MMQAKSRAIWMMVLVVLAGIAIRVFTAFNTCIINPDGMVYIQQAKAIYFGDWHLLKSCVPFVSNYPFFIAGVYVVYPDWIVAARGVSVFFGSLTLIPLYFLIRRFVDERTSFLCTLVYAFIPFLVGGSADLIRDPICWFFLVCGLYFFVSYLETPGFKRERLILLLLSYVAFVMAGWARPDAFMFLMFSILYSFYHSLRPGNKKQVLIPFTALLILVIICLVGLAVSNLSFHYYYENASSKLALSLEQYGQLRAKLGTLASDFRGNVLGSFLSKARSLVWFIALGVLLSSTIAGFFHPYFPFFVFGFSGIFKRLREDSKIGYLLTLFILAYGLLFFHVLQIWYFEHRFLYLSVFSGCAFAALGIEKIAGFLQRKLMRKASLVMIFLVFYVVAFGLGKNVKKREEDKVVYLQIAEQVSKREKSSHGFIPILTGNSSSLKLVSFYVNLDLPTGYCPFGVVPEIRNNEELIQYTQKNKVKYYIWDEKNWSKTQVDIHAGSFVENFETLGRWYHRDLGSIVLFCRDRRMGN